MGRYVIEEDAPPEATAAKRYVIEDDSAPAVNPFSLNTERLEAVGRGIKNAAGGLPRSGMGIVSNLMRPFDAVIPGGKDFDSGHNERMARVDSRFRDKGYDPESMAFQGGKMVGDIAITAPLGGALAAGAKHLPILTRAIPGLETALRTGGMKLGAPAATTVAGAARNAATRIGAGAFTGGAMAGTVDMDSAGAGALIGGALPPAVTGAGAAGRFMKSAIYNPLVNHNAIIGNTLARAVGNDNIAGAVSGTLRTPKTPGVQFTAGQQTGNPVFNAFEDTLRTINPGGELNRIAQQNNSSLAGTMRGIAKDDIALEAAKQAREAATGSLYEKAKQVVMKDDGTLKELLKRPVMSKAMRNAVNLAKERGEYVATKAAPTANKMIDPNKDDLLMAVRKMGGISQQSFDNMFGQSVRNDLKFQPSFYGPIFNKAGGNGSGVDEMARELYGKGYLQSDDVGELLDRLVDSGMYDKPVFSVFKQEIASDPLTDAVHQLTAKLGERNAKAVAASMIKDGQISGKALHDIKLGLDDAIGNPGTGGLSGAQRQAAMDTKAEFMSLLESRIPEYANAKAAYEGMSRPINQMQVGQLLANKLIPSTAGDIPSRLNAASLAGALRNPDQVAKTATGFKGARLNRVLDPSQLTAVRGVNADASRIAEMNSLGAGYGSATARRQSLGNFVGENLSAEHPVASRVVGAIGNMPLLNVPFRMAGAAANAMGGNINSKIAGELEAMLAKDPELLRKLLLEAQRRGVAQTAITEPSMSPIIRAGLLNMGANQSSP